MVPCSRHPALSTRSEWYAAGLIRFSERRTACESPYTHKDVEELVRIVQKSHLALQGGRPICSLVHDLRHSGRRRNPSTWFGTLVGQNFQQGKETYQRRLCVAPSSRTLSDDPWDVAE